MVLKKDNTRFMKQYIIFTLFLVLLWWNIFAFTKYMSQSTQEEVRISSDGQNFSSYITSSLEKEMSYEEALATPDNLEDIIHRIEPKEKKKLFIDMYESFKKLETIQEYEAYVQKYPELLPVIYAVRLQDKEMYIKFYGFLFDKVEREGIYLDDVKKLVWNNLEWAELKKWFLDQMREHYEDIISGNFTFNTKMGDDPLLIALTSDSVETALQNCDSSEISSVDISTQAECYGYVYQYRATPENTWCDMVESEYQSLICTWFLQYISN